MSNKGSRGGTIKRIGEKLFQITWHQGRGRANIRRKVRGTYQTAQRVLDSLHDRYYAGEFGWPQPLDTKVCELTALVVADYRTNGRKSLKSAKQLQAFWDQLAGHLSATAITNDQLTKWSNEWRAAGLSAGRVNRRMSFLLRAFRLGMDKQPALVTTLPKFKKLEEAPPRGGVRTWAEFVTVRDLLPSHAKIPVTIEYWLGTREGETLKLPFKQVYFHTTQKLVEIQLEAIDTKTSEPRRAIMGGDLYDTLLAWHKLTQKQYPGCPWVCHRDGKRLTSIKTSWRTACVRCGLGHFLNPTGRFVGNRQYRGALIHDFRRTAVSEMEDAGVPRKIGMLISGHKTDSMYRRYHIVSKSRLIEAGRRRVEYHRETHGNSDSRVTSSRKTGPAKGGKIC